jgi:hypothetical protein
MTGMRPASFPIAELVLGTRNLTVRFVDMRFIASEQRVSFVEESASSITARAVLLGEAGLEALSPTASTRFAFPVLLTGGADRLFPTSPTRRFNVEFIVTPVTWRTERMVTIIIALPLWVAAVVDVAVLLLTAIFVVGAFRSAFGAVDIKVALSSVDKTNGPLVHSLAGRPFDGTGAVERSDVNRIAGVGRVLHVGCISDVHEI